MLTVYNKILPFRGFKAFNFLGLILFVRSDAKTLMQEKDFNHENIHSKQYLETLWIGFLIWYGIEWLIKLCIYKDTHKAYKNISFERESYQNQENLEYLNNRKAYAWFKYIKQ